MNKFKIIGYLLLVCCLWLCGEVQSATPYISTIAGGGVCDGSDALLVSLNNPSGLVISQSGELYIADTSNNRIRKVFTNGTVITVVGDGIGADLGDSNVLGTTSRLKGPEGMIINSVGEVFFADRQNGRVKKLLTNGFIVTIAGSNTMGAGADNVIATSSKLNFPKGVAIDVNGMVLIADTVNNKIRKILGTGYITTIAGGGNSLGDGGQAVDSQLNQPGGVAVSPVTKEIFIADSYNNRIRKIDTNGIITTFAGTGTPLPNENGVLAINAKFSPQSIAINAAGEIFLTDGNTSNILKILTNGTILIIAGTGSLGYNGDNIPATQAQLSNPRQIVFDPVQPDTFYFADSGNNRIRKISNGIISTVVGTGAMSYCGANDYGVNVPLDHPSNIAIDSDNSVYFSDSNNQRIRKLSADGKIVNIAGDGGYSNNIVDGVAATASSLYYPQGICLTPEGDVLIAEQNGARIRRVFKSNGTIITIAGTGTAGTSGDNGPATSAKLKGPAGIAYYNGEVYFAEANNNKIRKIDANGIISTFAGTGAYNFAGENGPAISAQFKSPMGIAIDQKTGDIYITDRGNNRIRKIFNSNNTIVTIAGTGAAISSGDSGLAINAAVNSPTGIYVDQKTGDVYITESTRVRKISAASGIITTVAGTNSGGFNKDGLLAFAQINTPTDAALNSNGDLIIADFSNSRIRRVYLVSTCNNLLPTDAGVCGGHGSCTGQDVCQCNTGYGGPFCQYSTCNSILSNDISVCNNHGMCIAPETCQCAPTHNGQYCDHLITTPGITCFGLAQNDPKVCSGRGSCVSNNVCQCSLAKYTGSDCSTEVPLITCFGLAQNDPKVCSGRGSCVSNDVCKCSLSKYKGSDCSTELVPNGVCFGLASNDSKVCSAKGICVANDSCSCDGNWGGVDCSTCLPSYTGNNCEQLITCSDGSCDKLYALFVLLSIPIAIIIIVIIVIVVVVVRKKKKKEAAV